LFGWNGVAPVVAHADVGAGYYLRPDGEDQYLAGWLHPAPEVDADRFAERIGDDEVEALVRAIVTIIGGTFGPAMDPVASATVLVKAGCSYYSVARLQELRPKLNV
jgi:hypothetical protein